jgi:hypothetical protein
MVGMAGTRVVQEGSAPVRSGRDGRSCALATFRVGEHRTGAFGAARLKRDAHRNQ